MTNWLDFLFEKRFFADLKDCPEYRADLTLDTSDWNNLVVFRTSSDISCDHELDDVRLRSEKKLLSEFAYASYLAVPAVLLSLPSRVGNDMNYSWLFNWNKLINLFSSYLFCKDAAKRVIVILKKRLSHVL